jgi:PAS domain S-box-containing protein
MRRSLNQELLLISFVVVVILTLIVGVAVFNLRALNDSADNLITSRRKFNQMSEFDSNVMRTMGETSMYVQTKDTPTGGDHRDEVEEFLTNTQQNLDRLDSLVVSPDERSLLQEQHALYATVRQRVDGVEQAITANGDVRGALDDLFRADRDSDALREQIHQRLEQENSHFEQAIGTTIESVSYLVGGTLAVFGVLLLTVFVLLQYAIIRPIKGLSTIVAAVANGNFDQPVPVTSQNEIGVLQQTFNQMIENLRASRAEVSGKQRALEDERQRYVDLFEFAPDGYLLTEMTGTIQEANRAAAALLDQAPPDLIGQPLSAYLSADDALEFGAQLQRLAHVDRVQDWDVHVRTTDGTPRIISITVMAVRRQEGAPTVLRWLLRDITERKRMEEERIILERKLLETQKLESLGVLAGGVAHDFNNLLAVILGNVEMALFDLPADSSVMSFLQQSTLAAQRAADLTNQMLAYSGKGRFVVQPIDLNALITELITLLSAAVPKHVTVHYELDPQLPAIHADATQIRQIVMNLMINAAEAIGPSNGTITLTTRVNRVDQAQVTTTDPTLDLVAGDYITLTVADTGCGMDEATRGRIFEPFFTTKFTGRGLGLAAISGIVRSHNGAMQVQSALGQGTTFTILFPSIAATVVQPSRPLVHAALPSSPTLGGTILVVEDEADVRLVVTLVLERFGFSVLTASEGQTGIEAFRAHADEIGCVLLDMTMPFVNGDVVFREIHRIKPDARIVLMSGYSEEEIQSHFAGPWPAGFLHKPFTPNEVHEKVQQALGSPVTIG